MRFEGELGRAAELSAEVLGHVLALDVELLARRAADDGVGQIDAQLRNGILAQVVVILELVQELGRGDDVVCRVVAPGQLVAALTL